MEKCIVGIYLKNTKPHFVTIFGYKSKGYPGLNIIGPNGYVRALKEKIIFLTKSRSLPIPLGKYVICIDLKCGDVSNVLNTEIEFLDFPILLLFWSLAEILKLMTLNGCIASGKVSSQGLIGHMDNLEEIDVEKINKNFTGNNIAHNGPIYIGLKTTRFNRKEKIYCLNSLKLLSGIAGLKQIGI